jgi:hypothetical protein
VQCQIYFLTNFFWTSPQIMLSDRLTPALIPIAPVLFCLPCFTSSCWNTYTICCCTTSHLVCRQPLFVVELATGWSRLKAGLGWSIPFAARAGLEPRLSSSCGFWELGWEKVSHTWQKPWLYQPTCGNTTHASP